MRKKYWFTAKKYGWGWKPSSWEGWSILILYILILFYFFFQIDSRSRSASDTLISFVPVVVVLSGIFIAICYRKGESPRWQWGERTKKDIRKKR